MIIDYNKEKPESDGTYFGYYGYLEEPCLIVHKNKAIEKIVFDNLSKVTPEFHDLSKKIIFWIKLKK